ncbi:hypothetical protein [Microbacterium rhizophilus]|uniref:hypothetical protein n=1 Tax=Microbacterium rhizophilus TaxID=3138934 RepID=UPI0031EC49D5
MPLILSLAMIVPGAVCVACAAATRPRASRTAILGAAAMLAAMIAMAAGSLGSPIAWTAALVGIAVVGAAARRVRRGRVDAASHEAFDWHRPVGIVVMAALIAGHSAGAPASAGHAHGPSAAALPLLALAYVAALVVWMLRRRRDLTPRHAAEGISMAVMTVAMVFA